MTNRAVLFDLDGTLLDTAADFRTALNRLLADEGHPPLDLPAVRTMVSNGSANLVAQAFRMDSAHPEFEPLRGRLLNYYAECMLENTHPFPGIQESLDILQDRGVHWGIVTNKPELFSQAIIAGLKLEPGTLICPENTGKPKPDPAGILLACSQLGCEPPASIYIGDHLRDIEAGRAAGCRTMAAAYGYLDADDNALSWGADWVVERPHDLPSVLQEYLE